MTALEQENHTNNMTTMPKCCTNEVVEDCNEVQNTTRSDQFYTSVLLKLENQWKKFLADDRAASCSLKPMARPLRKFVHEYGDFWK
mmetsp:Transcript_39030/g.70302  ORF Transcript_39030/g.70302 Transcript_39030/m.70302 type:complete len:86 (+) Transcript_39030:890-1147(+)